MAYKIGVLLVHGAEIHTLRVDGGSTRYFGVCDGRVQEYLPGARSKWVWVGPGLRLVAAADEALESDLFWLAATLAAAARDLETGR